MNKKDRTILIEQYLDGKLQGDDLKNFEILLRTEEEFTQDFSLQKEIRDTLSKKDFQDLREKLKAVNENFEKEKQFAIKRKPVLFYAISAIIIIAVIISIYIFNKTYTNDELFLSYYKQYDADIITRGAEETPKDIYTQALRAYDYKKYYEALALFNQISATSEFIIQKEYFTGLSYMELHKFDEAIRHFENASSDKRNAFYDDVIWYLGLCYLKTNQTNLAIQQFKKLLKNDSFYKKSASEIIEKME